MSNQENQYNLILVKCKYNIPIFSYTETKGRKCVKKRGPLFHALSPFLAHQMKEMPRSQEKRLGVQGIQRKEEDI